MVGTDGVGVETHTYQMAREAQKEEPGCLECCHSTRQDLFRGRVAHSPRESNCVCGVSVFRHRVRHAGNHSETI